MSWYGFQVVDGKDTQHPAFKRRGMPALVARYRMDAPYPDIEVVVPMTANELRRWALGDNDVLDSLHYRLEGARFKLLARDEPAVLV